MSYKIIVLAPSCGGKSTLMRYLRKNTDLDIAETDEEVMKANHNIWPDDELKNKVLVPQTTQEILSRDSVIYLASYIPTELIAQARKTGFKIVLLNLSTETLNERNNQRIEEEGYQDVSAYFKMQLDNYTALSSLGYIDLEIDGNQAVESISRQLIELAK